MAAERNENCEIAFLKYCNSRDAPLRRVLPFCSF